MKEIKHVTKKELVEFIEANKTKSFTTVDSSFCPVASFYKIKYDVPARLVEVNKAESIVDGACIKNRKWLSSFIRNLDFSTAEKSKVVDGKYVLKFL